METKSAAGFRGKHADPFYQANEKLAFLKTPPAWPEKPERVVFKETHMSWVFLTGIYAWKMKKPVSCDLFLDFRALGKREHCCREELRLNRRLAPDIYLDVVPLVQDSRGRFSVGGRGEVVDWLVKMKQLPADATLRARMENDSLDGQDIKAIAVRLSRFFDTAKYIDMAPADYISGLKETIDYNFARLLEADYEAQRTRMLRETQNRQLDFLGIGRALLTKRVLDRKIIEGHGDLRPEHIYLLEPQPVMIDCIEFNRDLRLVDRADELSFLQMMCANCGNEEAGKQVFDIYRQETGDRPPAVLIAFYAGFRAATRARLAQRHIQDAPYADPAKWNRRLRQFLDLAQMYGERQEESL